MYTVTAKSKKGGPLGRVQNKINGKLANITDCGESQRARFKYYEVDNTWREIITSVVCKVEKYGDNIRLVTMNTIYDFKYIDPKEAEKILNRQPKKFYAKVVTFDAGYDCEQKEAKKLFTLNQKYEIGEVDIYPSHTEVFLKEFGDKIFNSVFFDFYDEDGIKYNFLDLPIAHHFYY